MSSADPHAGLIRLGAACVTLTYPASLSPWFSRLPMHESGTAPSSGEVAIIAEPGDRFTVLGGDGPARTQLSEGDAIAIAWERAAYLILNPLSATMAVHAACLRRGQDVVLLPGASGAGKSRLALWYRALGFEIGTDELVALSVEPGGLVIDALGRPLVVKGVADLQGLIEDVPERSALTSAGLVAALPDGGGWAGLPATNILVVAPHFQAGAALALRPLTAAQTAMTLMGHCVNARNLPDGGLSVAARLGKNARAIELIYGDTAQLPGMLDVLSRILLRTYLPRDDFAVLCDAFQARGSSPRSDGVSSAAPSPRPTQTATASRFRRRLTVGMTTFDDYDGVYFTIQSIRMGHPELADDLEFVVIDNNPTGACAEALAQLAGTIEAYRYVPRGDWSGTAMKNAVFEEASSPNVVCLDAHVLVVPGALTRLIERLEADPDSRDLIQGPLLADDLRSISTHMEPRWSRGMYGVWADDPRGHDPAAEAFEIPMHGMGLFACRRTAWAGFNPAFRGFGAEEGYIHEKSRRNGGRTLCCPFLRWAHRFGRPLGVPYVNRWEDRIRNYLIGFDELGLETAGMEAHFAEVLGVEVSARIFRETRAELGLVTACAQAFD